MLTEGTDLSEEVLVKAAKACEALVPQKTKHVYEKEYSCFQEWLTQHSVSSINETVMMAYFQDLSESYSPNSLWTKFSMLRKELIVKKKIRSNEAFVQVQQFLKQTGRRYQPKKSKVLTRDQVLTFLKEAPTEEYLLEKAVLVMGVFGACRRDELVKMRFTDLRDLGTHLLINIPQSKNGQQRSFLIIEESEMNALSLLRRYVSLRPKGASDDRLFLCYRNKRCTVQPVGKNTIGNIPCKIATYLGLGDAKAYTGHCLRRTAATLHSDAGGNSESLMRLGGWKSSSVARGYVDNSDCSRMANASLVAGMKTSTHTAVRESTVKIISRNVNSIDTATAGPSGNNDFSGHFENCTFYIKE